MLVNVPQYIDVEDKIAGPLTAKQLGWLFGMGAVMFFLWTTLEKAMFYVACIPVATVFVALAFYRPFGRPLMTLVGNSINFFVNPKMFIWKREYKKVAEAPVRSKDEKKVDVEMRARVKSKEEALADVMSIGRFLDSEGQARNEKLMQILAKKKSQSKK